jgi:hypothetical protein
LPPPTISPTPILTQPSTKRISQHNIIISQCSGCSRFSTLDNSRICAEYRIRIQEHPTKYEVFHGVPAPSSRSRSRKESSPALSRRGGSHRLRPDLRDDVWRGNIKMVGANSAHQGFRQIQTPGFFFARDSVFQNISKFSDGRPTHLAAIGSCRPIPFAPHHPRHFRRGGYFTLQGCLSRPSWPSGRPIGHQQRQRPRLFALSILKLPRHHHGGAHDNPPPGVAGGQAGAPTRIYKLDLNGNRTDLGISIDVTLQPGEKLLSYGNGGGGFGDPTKRDMERVRERVREGWLSADAARERYGLAIDNGVERT